MSGCIDHLSFTNGRCPDCDLPVDAYGNTEDQFEHCSFPDCGCDGARLCMAGEASERAQEQNVEGMWTGKTLKQRRAAMSLMNDVTREQQEQTND